MLKKFLFFISWLEQNVEEHDAQWFASADEADPLLADISDPLDLPGLLGMSWEDIEAKYYMGEHGHRLPVGDRHNNIIAAVSKATGMPVEMIVLNGLGMYAIRERVSGPAARVAIRANLKEWPPMRLSELGETVLYRETVTAAS